MADASILLLEPWSNSRRPADYDPLALAVQEAHGAASASAWFNPFRGNWRTRWHASVRPLRLDGWATRRATARARCHRGCRPPLRCRRRPSRRDFSIRRKDSTWTSRRGSRIALMSRQWRRATSTVSFGISRVVKRFGRRSKSESVRSESGGRAIRVRFADSTRREDLRRLKLPCSKAGWTTRAAAFAGRSRNASRVSRAPPLVVAPDRLGRGIVARSSINRPQRASRSRALDWRDERQSVGFILFSAKTIMQTPTGSTIELARELRAETCSSTSRTRPCRSPAAVIILVRRVFRAGQREAEEQDGAGGYAH